ncbi:MAG: patatin-like phospholipase family protein [Saprospiraceae bacterium]|nr:patatin-like phospholipase family protein [Saprospiraceae bacterium]
MSRIALCCSGGGYRAASFHLGALTYLHELKFEGKPLLHRVVALSTVSGGTITGVVYALHQQKGKSFAEFYHFLLQQLKSTDLVRLGLEKLNTGAVWQNTSKRKNLINAFAEIYDMHFTQGETFDVFSNMAHSHLEEVMFNATEFSKGVIFRFQSDGRFGNYYFPVKKDISAEIKLSDIIAASSCFPGGFEPIEWPDDFVHSETIELKEELPLMAKVGLMDGGIYDNQGIDSILLSETRANAKPFDLIIISDVTSPYFHPFEFSKTRGDGKWSNQTFYNLTSRVKTWYTRIKWGLFILSCVCIIYLGYSSFVDSTLTGIALTLLVLVSGLIFLMISARKKIEGYISDKLQYFKSELADDLPLDDLHSLKFSKIPLGRFEPLILDRIKSLTILISTIFLKTVRRLVYGRLYDSEEYRFRRASNLIRQLTREDYEQQQMRNQHDQTYYQNLEGCDPGLKGSYEQVIGEKLEEIAQDAASFGTTLWFLEKDRVEDRLNSLIITGQASMCFTLLKYLTELQYTPGNGYDDLSQSQKREIDHLYQKCRKDWERFKVEPDFLNEKMQRNPA